MRLRPHRRNLVIWSSSADVAARHGALRFTRPARSRRIHRWIRHGVLLTVIGVIRLAEITRTHWPVLAGGLLTVVGVMMRSGAGGIALLPGMLLLLVAMLSPPSPKAARMQRSELERELAAYSTPAQRRDLEATLDRYPDGITGELRDILARQTQGRR
jgi:hypothetical protein